MCTWCFFDSLIVGRRFMYQHMEYIKISELRAKRVGSNHTYYVSPDKVIFPLQGQ